MVSAGWKYSQLGIWIWDGGASRVCGVGTRVPTEDAFSPLRLGLGSEPPGDGAGGSDHVYQSGCPLPHSTWARGPVGQQHSPRECSRLGMLGGQHVYVLKSGVMRVSRRRGSRVHTVLILPFGLTSSPQYSQIISVSMKSSMIISPSIVITDNRAWIPPGW